jgi:hypothetical protein
MRPEQTLLETGLGVAGSRLSMVLQTCHASKLERSLDSLSEGWMKPHCYFSGGGRGSDRPQYTDRENVCAVGSHPATSRGLNRFHGQENGPSGDLGLGATQPIGPAPHCSMSDVAAQDSCDASAELQHRGQDFRGTGSWPHLRPYPEGCPMQRNPRSVSAIWLFLLSCLVRGNGLLWLVRSRRKKWPAFHR